MRLLPAKGLLESISTDILRKLIKAPLQRENYFLLVMTDRFFKLVQTIPMKSINALEFAKSFVHHWIFVDDPPQTLLSDNGKQFNARLFIDICRLLGIKNQFTITCHPQANGQLERFNRPIFAARRHYVADHTTDWDLYTDSLTYTYKTSWHTTTGLALFELVLRRSPPALAVGDELTFEMGLSQQT